MKIGVTGSEGLVGVALCRLLAERGHAVSRFDLRCPSGKGIQGDVLDRDAVGRLVAGCDGIIHLAAVSRVVWGERDPKLCRRTNVNGTRYVVEAAASGHHPWVVLASSREVYGEPQALPVTEAAPLQPMNVYGRSKLDAEALVMGARTRGLRTVVLRLSNVYGSVVDHHDRVVPAFARAAAEGSELRVDGPGHTFDFTHVDDTARGIAATVDALASGEHALPPIHLLTGRPTTLRQLAEWAVAAGDGGSRIRIAEPRCYDVARFVGDPARARSILGWRAERQIEDGIRELVAAFRIADRVSPGQPALGGVA